MSFFTQLFKSGKSIEDTSTKPRMSEVGALDAPLSLNFCAKCGGFFKSEVLKSFFRGTVILSKDGSVGLPHFESVLYCQSCEPSAPLSFILQNDKGWELNTRFFRVEDGWFQDVDPDTGEDQYTISIEEYNHAFCTSCGELIEEMECQGCRKKAK